MRIDYQKVSPDAIKAMIGLEGYVNKCGLEKLLLELIKLRASQLNGCEYCVKVHRADALKVGESEERINAIAQWRNSSLFTARECAVLAWTEAVTLLPETHAPDDVYQEVTKHFNEKETVDLTMAIITINSWNRLAVSFRK